jgi:hypothetical protein
MRQTILAGLAVLALLPVAGCQIVHVTDQDGKAISWANVSATTQTAGTVGFPVKTDMLGNATLPISQEQPGTREYLEISKQGYITRRIIRPEDGRVEVQLMRSPRVPAKADAKKK